MTPNLWGMKDGINRIQPPLGPMIAASVMRDKYEHHVKIHDTALAGWRTQQDQPDGKTVIIGQDNKEIAEVVGEYKPDVVGISALFSNLVGSAHNIARVVKTTSPDTIVVTGGNYVSNSVSDFLYAKANPASNMPPRLTALEDQNIDYAMWGEVDFSWPELADALIQGKDVSRIPGLVVREGLDYIINSKPKALDVTTLPRPARDLVDMEAYFAIGAFHSPKSYSSRVLPVMASRGCPEVCSFCTTPEMWGKKVRWRTIEDIAAEIYEAINMYNIEEIQFEDDTLTANRRRLLELCDVLEQIGLPWCTPNGTKANYHQYKEDQLHLFQRMANAGCYQISIAGESGNQRVLDEIIKKKLRLKQVVSAIDAAKKVKMVVHTFWVVGFPGETREEIERTIQFAEDSGADSYSIAIFNPLPGTSLYRQVMKDNLWWPGRDISQMMFRNSLVRVDGFSGPEEFEQYVTGQTVRLQELGHARRPEMHQNRKGLEGLSPGSRTPINPDYLKHQT